MSILNKQPVAAFLFFTAIFLLPYQAVAGDSKAIVASAKAARTVAALVNGEPIYKDKLEKRLREATRKAKGFSNEDIATEEISQSSLKWALNEEIATELLYQGGKKLNIPDAEKKIAKEVDRIKASLTSEQREEYSGKEIEDYVQRRFYVNEYMAFNDLIDPRVPEEDIKAYYEKTKQGYARKSMTVRVRHVFAKADQDASEDERKLAHEKIEKAHQLLLSGKPFSDVAKEYSDDGEYPGSYGFIEPGFMPENFEKVAFSIEIGKISKIVKSKLGYHVMEVLEIRPQGSIPPYGSLKNFFEKYLSSELKIKKVPAHVKQIREKADIKILLMDEKSKT